MRKDFERIAGQPDDAAGMSRTPNKPPVLTLDVSLYEKYLAEGGLSDGQKREFLEALWTIIVGFVDLGFGIHPVQQAVDGRPFDRAEKNLETDGQGLVEFQSEGENDEGRRGKITRDLREKEDK